ncbi:MAG: phosphoribosylglycinamide formyltransferase [Ruminococcus sp.]
MKRIVVLVSGGGTNLQALIDAEKRGDIKSGSITCVISSKEDAFALERARKAGIPSRVVKRKDYPDADSYTDALLEVLREEKADLIILAGFMTILGEKLIRAYENKIVNVHPSLIPAFCGEGFYGLKVHEYALERGVKVSGATVHFVNEIADGGPIIMQQPVAVENGDTPEILQRRIMEQAEWKLLPKVAELFCAGRIKVTDGKAYITE